MIILLLGARNGEAAFAWILREEIGDAGDGARKGKVGSTGGVTREERLMTLEGVSKRGD
ncbi:MAG: hypothetical protein ACTJLL_03960 [Anaplasma sp.]